MARDSLFLIAGEASGDAMGALILDGLAGNPATKNLHCCGVGGGAMQKRGFDSLLPMDDFTVIGFAAIPEALPRLNRHANSLIENIMQSRPRAVITIDNKGFALRFARRLKAHMKKSGWHAPLIHVVAPTVWGWGGWRAKQFADVFDHLLCLFPFEKKYFAGFDSMRVSIIGHPAGDAPRIARKDARKKLGVDEKTKLLALLPGSRSREIASLLPDMLTAFDILRDDIPGLTAAIPMGANVETQIKTMVAHDKNALRLLPQKHFTTLLAAADYGMICSGTATLEAALAGLSGAVYYRPDMLTRAIASLIADRDKAVLANVVAGREVYPFFLNREFNAETMAAHAREYLTSGKNKTAMPKDFAKAISTKDGFAKTAAKAIASEL